MKCAALSGAMANPRARENCLLSALLLSQNHADSRKPAPSAGIARSSRIESRSFFALGSQLSRNFRPMQYV